jgi:RHS repeat-associated protein
VHQAASGTVHHVVDASLEFTDAHAMVWVTFGGRRVVAFVDGGAAYVHADGRGDPTLFTDAAGAELRRLAFGPFGSLRSDSAASGAVQPVFGGGERDTSGLVCLGRRFLDPHLGTFVTPDILIAGAYSLDGWNRYVYCRDNPLRYADPTGMISWEDVLAIVGIVILIAALVVAACFTGGVTLVAIPGLTMTLGGLFVATAIGVAAGAIIGGIAAAQAGGDLWKGILFGGVMGGLTAFAGGCFGAAIGASLSSLTFFGAVAIGAVEGALIGAGTGAAVGFAGGKGTAESILKNMLAGFITGAVIGAALGALSGIISGEGSNAALKIGTLDKYTGAAGPVSTSSNVLAFGQNTGELVAGGNPAGLAGSFVSIGQSAPITSFSSVFNVAGNGALVSIPIGWAPSAILGWGGVALVEGITTSLDVTGTYTFGQQLVLALSVVPFVGMIFGYGIGDGSSWEAQMEDWLNKNFSQSSPNAI